MKYIFCAFAIVVALIIWILTTKWANMDKKRQAAIIAGANDRKKYGFFDITKYAYGNVSATVPFRQNNSGPDPRTYDKKIPYVNHFSDFDSILPGEGNKK